jgi:hypothetical protein
MEGLTIVQMGGGINHMIFLMDQVTNSSVERVLYYYGKSSLNAVGDMPETRERPKRWHLPEIKGKRVTMLGYGGYHTLFLIDGQVFVRLSARSNM